LGDSLTISSLTEICNVPSYLKHKRNVLNFVMLGMFQNDPIERRFGWYRQLGGGNYYVSIRQVLEAEKSIRLRSLLKFSECDIKDVLELDMITKKHSEIEDSADVQVFTTIYSPEIPEVAKVEDRNVLFFVAGYFARSFSKKTRCESCHSMFIGDLEAPTAEISLADSKLLQCHSNAKRFLEQINRGGLVSPSGSIFLASLFVWEYLSGLQKDEQAKALLLSFKHPQRVFSECVLQSANEQEETSTLCMDSCANGHGFSHAFKCLAKGLFNMFAKNFVAEEMSLIHGSRKRSRDTKEAAAERKIAKLQSNN
jgi:hypothetical protein